MDGDRIRSEMSFLSSFAANRQRGVSSYQRPPGAQNRGRRKKERKKKTKTEDLVEVEEEESSRHGCQLCLFFLPSLASNAKPNRDLPGAARGDSGPDGHLGGQGESHSVSWCGKGELWGAGERVRGEVWRGWRRRSKKRWHSKEEEEEEKKRKGKQENKRRPPHREISHFFTLHHLKDP